MKISIITVCYNSSKTIENTFQSILEQKYGNIEYIVVDGGSTDSTLKIAKKYNNIIDILISEPDKGLYDAMNKGIASSSGDLIGILNSDDVFFNTVVLKQIAEFHEQNVIEASIGDIVQYNSQGKQIRLYSSRFWKPEKLKIGFMPPHPSIFFKRELFFKYGGYSLDYNIGADYELIIRFFLKHKISWKHHGNITTKMLVGGISSNGLKSYYEITKEIIKALRTNEIKFNNVFIYLRGVWKILEYYKKQ